MSAQIESVAAGIVKSYIQRHAGDAASVIVTIALKDISATAGGLSMSMLKGQATVTVDGAEMDPLPIVVKATKEAESSRSTTKMVGLNREAQFARDTAFQGLLGAEHPFFPFFLGAWNDDEEGCKVVVMGDLSLSQPASIKLPNGDAVPYETRFGGVQAGYFFGPVSLHNWGKDLAALTANFPGLSEKDVAERAAVDAGTLHGKFWRCSNELLRTLKSPEASEDGSRPWLRAWRWIIKGEDPESFTTFAKLAQDAWARFLVTNAETKAVNVAPQLAAMMKAVLDGCSFDRLVDVMRNGPCGYTVVHGDFHPANFMVVKKGDVVADGESDWDLVLLDWEVVGVGSGPQEIGQFLISHTTPASRAPYFQLIVEQYVASFNAARGESTITVAEATHEVVYGGLGRWVWLLAYIAASGAPPVATQYFHDQVWGFMQEHAVMTEDAFARIVLRV